MFPAFAPFGSYGAAGPVRSLRELRRGRPGALPSGASGRIRAVGKTWSWMSTCDRALLAARANNARASNRLIRAA